MRIPRTELPRPPKLPANLVRAALFAALIGFGFIFSQNVHAQGQSRSEANRILPSNEGNSSRDARDVAVQRIPFPQLTAEASMRLRSVIEDASYFRRMPVETVDCDPEMYAFLVRHPEVIVNIWDIMGVTKVTLNRTGPYQLQGNDGAGTTSRLDLVYGNESMHIYFANGAYKGSLWARELTGKCVVVLHNKPGVLPSGKPGMTVYMDTFMKLDNIGADLIVKTLGPLVSKTADYNFLECSAFISQISQTAETNPVGIQQLAKRLNTIDPKVREQFIATSNSVSERNSMVASSVANSKAAITASKPGPPKPVDMLVLEDKAVQLRELERSSRRQYGPAGATGEPDAKLVPIVEERVDSPTILLLGRDEKK